MLRCENVVKKYRTTTAVNGMTFTIEQGKIYALLGPNGSGKSTIMKMIAGLIKPTKGNITLDGVEIGVETKKQIAYMPTEAYFYSYMTCVDIGKYYADFFEDFSVDRFKELMKQLELEHTDKVDKMSSGMMAKLKLAVTLARDAKIYMLDEPLNGIDIIAREKIINTIIQAAKDDNTLIISSHLVDELENIIDNAIFIEDGVIVAEGEAEELREERGKSIVDIYKEIYA